MAIGAGAIRAGQAFVELLTDDNPLKRGLDAAAARIKSFGESLSAIGAKIGAAGAIVSAPFTAAAKAFADSGKALANLSTITGISAGRLSELAFAAGGVDNLERAFAHLSRTLDAADLGSREAATALGRLGLTSAQLAGMPLGDRFTEITGRLGGVSDASTRAAIAFKLFGEGAGELLPMLARGREGMDAAIARGRELGLVMSDEQVASAVALSKAYKLLDGALKGIWQTIGSAVAPTLTEATNLVAGAVRGVSRWVSENKDLIVTLFKWGAGIAAAGGAIVALGAAISTATKVISGLSSVFSLVSTVAGAVVGVVGAAITGLITVVTSLFTPVGLATAAFVGLGVAIGAAGVYFAATSKVGRELISGTINGFRAAAGTAVAAWGGIKDALATGDLGAAARIAWGGVKLAFAQVTLEIRAKWIDFTSYLSSQWEILKVGLAATWEGFKATWETVTAGLQAYWEYFTTAVSALWNHALASLSATWEAVSGTITAGFDMTAAAAEESSETSRKSWLDTIKEWYFGLLRVRDLMRELGFEFSGFTVALDAIQAVNEGINAGQAAADEGVRSRQGALAEKQREIEEARQRRQQELQDGLRQQQEELQAAIDDAARKRAEAAGGGAGPGGAAPVNPAAEAADRAQVAGGFNVVSGGMGFATSLAERQLQAAQETNKKLDNIFDVLKEGGETFR